MTRCGNCGNLHETSADVRRCYGLPSSQGASARVRASTGTTYDESAVFAAIGELVSEDFYRIAAMRIAAYSKVAGFTVEDALSAFFESRHGPSVIEESTKLRAAVAKLLEEEEWDRRREVREEMRRMQLDWGK